MPLLLLAAATQGKDGFATMFEELVYLALEITAGIVLASAISAAMNASSTGA